MADGTSAAQRDRKTQRANQILSGLVACVVLGVGGAMAYQNRDSFTKVPDRNAAWSGFWTKKLSKPQKLPQFELPESKPIVDWETTTMFDASKLNVQVMPLNQSQPSGGSRSSSAQSHRRR